MGLEAVVLMFPGNNVCSNYFNDHILLLQFIASAPTLFPAEYVREFQSCLDKTPPVPFEDIKAVIRKELGRPLEEVYDFVDPRPLASASIAQV